MIIIFPQGRLGNQIFQYQFALSQLKNRREKIITTWKCEYHKVFEDGLNYSYFPNPRNYCYLFFRYLASIGIISSILPAKEIVDGYPVETGSFVKKKGIISCLKFIDGFFQTDRYACPDVLKIREPLLQSARLALNTLSAQRKIFVHIRRGDYIDYAVFGKKDCTIPASYYEKAMSRFLADKDIGFIIMSDDKKYAEDLFPDASCKKIVHSGSPMLDFALMSICDGAIISSSSFSWWGAYLIKGPGLVVGPKYWLGFKSKLWYPLGIDTSRFEFMDAE